MTLWEETWNVRELSMALAYVKSMDYNEGNTGEFVDFKPSDQLKEAQQLMNADPHKFRPIEDIHRSLESLNLNSVHEKDLANRIQVMLMRSD